MRSHGILTLHTIGVHYNYAEVPIGPWLIRCCTLGAIISIGWCIELRLFPSLSDGGSVPAECQYPGMGGVLLAGHDRAGLSGLWEIIESWVRAVHPVGVMYLGSQGDIWDAKGYGCGTHGALLSGRCWWWCVRCAGGDSVGIGDGVPE